MALGLLTPTNAAPYAYRWTNALGGTQDLTNTTADQAALRLPTSDDFMVINLAVAANGSALWNLVLADTNMSLSNNPRVLSGLSLFFVADGNNTIRTTHADGGAAATAFALAPPFQFDLRPWNQAGIGRTLSWYLVCTNPAIGDCYLMSYRTYAERPS